jgi:hypothetical protein
VKRSQPAWLGTSPEDYARLGVQKGRIEQWEDGRRTDGSAGTFEWWYFDCLLDDGTKLICNFNTKPIADVDKPLTPLIDLAIDHPDGSNVHKRIYAPPGEFFASRDECDVRIGRNTFSGDLQSYRIHLEIDEIVADIALTATAPPWRPETGVIRFGERGEQFFGWLPSVPEGKVEAMITIGGETKRHTGTGYHEHNWGNRSLRDLVHDWYWARGTIDGWTVIACYITAERNYGYRTFPIFMLSRDGRIVADDASKVAFSASNVETDAITGKPFANKTSYDYRDVDTRFRLTFDRKDTILRWSLIDQISGWKKLAARAIGFDGAYLRFTGDLLLERLDGDRVLEDHREPAIWELMYFGKTRR